MGHGHHPCRACGARQSHSCTSVRVGRGAMFQNYLITALRNLTRHKLYSFINITGLTVGLTCAIFIILLVRDELSYDTWLPGTNNLYRVEQTFHVPEQPVMRSNSAAFPMP